MTCQKKTYAPEKITEKILTNTKHQPFGIPQVFFNITMYVGLRVRRVGRHVNCMWSQWVRQ